MAFWSHSRQPRQVQDCRIRIGLFLPASPSADKLRSATFWRVAGVQHRLLAEGAFVVGTHWPRPTSRCCAGPTRWPWREMAELATHRVMQCGGLTSPFAAASSARWEALGCWRCAPASGCCPDRTHGSAHSWSHCRHPWWYGGRLSCSHACSRCGAGRFLAPIPPPAHYPIGSSARSGQGMREAGVSLASASRGPKKRRYWELRLTSSFTSVRWVRCWRSSSPVRACCSTFHAVSSARTWLCNTAKSARRAAASPRASLFASSATLSTVDRTLSSRASKPDSAPFTLLDMATAARAASTASAAAWPSPVSGPVGALTLGPAS